MALTWREDRPEAITAASHSAERPSRSMVTIFSALSSSREVRMRLSRSLGGADFCFVCLRASGATCAAATFLGATFFAGFLAGFLAVFLAPPLAGFLADFVALIAAFALAAGFLTALLVRARVL
jgi:hypothetical protein